MPVATSKLALQEELQEEFCALDTSLIAAFIADLGSDPPSKCEVDDLRLSLALLAADAEKQAEEEDFCLNEAFTDVRITDDSVRSSSGPYDASSSGATSTSATTSPTSDSPKSESSSVASFTSPLGFLQAAFPRIPRHRLQAALNEAGYTFDNVEDIDIVTVIEGLLSKEYVKDLEERGLDALDDDLDDLSPRTSERQSWETVQSKKAAKKKGKGKTIALNDVRQQHHVRPGAPRKNGGPMAPSLPPPDPWTQVSSLSSHLSSLVPTHPPSFFQSFFHSPESATPATAIRAALTSIAGADDDIIPENALLLFNMHDFLRLSPDYDLLDAEARDRLLSDAALCLRATQAQPDEAMELTWFLRDLDADADAEWAMGPYHSAIPIPTTPPSRHVQKLPSGPPSAKRPAPTSRAQRPMMSIETSSLEPPPRPTAANAWNTVPEKKPLPGLHPLVASIPAYNPLNGISAKARAKARAQIAMPGDVGSTRAGAREAAVVLGALSGVDGKEAQKQKRRMEELRVRRAEAILSAGRAWQKGNAKNKGGEVAMFYAEQARELQEQVRKEALVAARSRVEAKTVTTAVGTTVDLHGTTVAEAITIAKEALTEHRATSAQPVKFITGRGNHSVNRVGVLAPAIKTALLEDGWNVSTFDAGIVVRGRAVGRP